MHRISAIASQGTELLCQEIMTYIEERNLKEEGDFELAEQEAEIRTRMESEARARMRQLAEERKARRLAKKAADAEDDDFDDDDDEDIEVFYAP